MNILVIHKHFPGQFLNICRYLAAEAGHKLVGIGAYARDSECPFPVFRYAPPPPPSGHPYLREFEDQVRCGQEVARICLNLKRDGFRPDVILSHPGWGESLFLKEVFPRALSIVYAEFFYRSTDSDLDFDPEFPPFREEIFSTRVRNSALLTSIDAADLCIAPTEWQRSLFPAELQSRITVIHDGIRTDRLRPDSKARFTMPAAGLELGVADSVITYVSRSLEPYRGFHTFMRALPEILARHPGARALVIGDDETVYGRRFPDGDTYRNKLLAELKGRLPEDRVHFVGSLSHAAYVSALQVSSAHVYLTYPFVLSWSMLESMAAGCAMAASSTAPVREVIEHGRNGYLFDFFSPAELAGRVLDILASNDRAGPIRRAARETVRQKYDFLTASLPKYLRVLGLAD